LLAVVGGLTGEWKRLDPSQVSLTSALCIVYLALMGSVVAFTAYLWLLRHTSASRVSTYAFVNPLVALLLGWIVGGEQLSLRTLVAALFILAAVALILYQRPARKELTQPVPKAARAA